MNISKLIINSMSGKEWPTGQWRQTVLSEERDHEDCGTWVVVIDVGSVARDTDEGLEEWDQSSVDLAHTLEVHEEGPAEDPAISNERFNLESLR